MEILRIKTIFPLTSMESVIVYSINYTFTKMPCGNNVMLASTVQDNQ